MEDPSALQHPVQDRLRQIRIVQHAPPLLDRLVGGEHHRPPMKMPLVHYLEQHIGGVRAVRQVPYLVDHQHPGVRVGSQRLPQPALSARRGELVDEMRCRHEPSVRPVLDRLVGDGDRHVRLSGPRRPVEEEVPSLEDELGAEVAPEQLLAQPRLEDEVELFDGPQEGEPGSVGHPRNACLGSMGDLLAHQELQIVRVAHLLLLRPHLQLAPQPSDRGHVQPPQHPVQLDLRRHARTSFSSRIPQGRVKSGSMSSAPCQPRSTA